MRILVGYDGSNVAKEALDIAYKHAKALNIGIYVITSMVGGSGYNKVAEIEKAEKKLEYIKKVAAKADIPCETHLLVRGMTPAEDLVWFAKENPVEEIVIGVKRRSKVGKVVFGSTAQYVILNAPCPVVSVK